MLTRLKGWIVPLMLLGVAAYAIAEEITLTTYYPSPRGVYDQLRTAGNVQIGSIEPSGLLDPNVPRLHIVGDGTHPPFRVDDAPIAAGASSPPLPTDYDSTPFVIDSAGNVGIGTANPGTTLDVIGALTVRGGSASAVAPAGQGRITFDSTTNTFKFSENGGTYEDFSEIVNKRSVVFKRVGTNIECPKESLVQARKYKGASCHNGQNFGCSVAGRTVPS